MVVRMSMAGAAAAAASSVLPCTTRVVLSTSPSTASSSSLPPSLKFSRRTRRAVLIRSSNADGPLRRPLAPAAPPLQPPPSTTSVTPKPATSPAPVAAPAEAGRGGAVTLEFQRKMAKEMQEYFRVKKIEEADQGPFFGFLGKNEIANGRWAMFGFAVGMLTEYATGSSFVDQLKILLSNFGIVDLE